MPCYVFIRWHCHYLFVLALVEEHCHSSNLLENLFMFLDTWVFCSFNVKTIKEGENGLFIYLYFCSQGCILSLGKCDVVLTS